MKKGLVKLISVICGLLLVACQPATQTTVPLSETGIVEKIPESESVATAVTNDVLLETEKLTPQKRTELLHKTLEDAQKDTALVDGKIKTKGLSFTVPEGFEPLADNPNMYVTRRYSLDISNIYYQEKEVDYLLQLMTEESFLQMTQEALRETYQLPVTLQIDSFEETKIRGIPSFVIQSRFTLEGVEVMQTIYLVNADKTYLLTYTTTNEYDVEEAFLESQKTIDIEL